MRYTALLLDVGARTNLVGTLDPERLLDEIVLDSVHLAEVLPEPPGVLLDVGSGAGLPGLPVLLARPDWRAVLLEPRRRRVDFLRHAVDSLGLRERAQVVEARLDDALAADLLDVPFDAVAAKAVFPPPQWAERARDLVRTGGRAAFFLQGGEADPLPDLGDRADHWAQGPLRAWRLRDGAQRRIVTLERTLPDLPESP
ncbi:MAG: hypothetical protein EA398_12640 [Deltaproteobacteria bacterium]|nr:MAG: hypothetical protein EA398_12640 [Deltaproteobacteria bacterium]